jgi:Flp pilus assembly protein TadB
MTDREHARDLLVNELRDAVGEDAVERADLDVDRAIERRPRSIRGAFESSRLLLIVIGAALLVAGVIASLATENWVFFGVAIAAHALCTLVVVGTAFAAVGEAEKPAPTTEAQLEAEGVRDPSGALNDLVQQVDESRR